MALGDHSIWVASHVCGASVKGTNPSWFARLSSLFAPAAPASAAESAAPANNEPSTRVRCFIDCSLGGGSARGAVNVRTGSQLDSTPSGTRDEFEMSDHERQVWRMNQAGTVEFGRLGP